MSQQNPTPIFFSCIAGLTRNWGIGYQNRLPWKKFSEDMKFFSETTQNSVVIMGRKTWESMNRQALPNRNSIIISSKARMLEREYESGKFHFSTSLSDALEFSFNKYKGKSIYVIGGKSLYEESLEHPGCHEVYLTQTNLNLPSDVKFPNLSQTDYYLAEIINTNSDAQVIPWSDINPEKQAIPLKTKYEICVYRRHYQEALRQGPSCYSKNQEEQGYLEVLKDIIDYGETRADRTGVGTKALFGVQFKYDLERNFPLLTTKRTFWRAIKAELLWFLRGQTDSKILENQGVNIWKGNTSREFLDSLGSPHSERREGDGGPIYGFNLRHWGADYKDCDTNYEGQGFDQVAYVLDLLKNNPTSRRIFLTMWNPSVLDQACLPSCHVTYQFYVEKGKYLHCSMYQRSGDMGLGVPFNIASASLMTYIFGHLTGLIPKSLTHTVGDCHIYLNHIEPLKRQIQRTPRPFPLFEMKERGQKKVKDYEADDFIIKGYYPYPGIKMEMAV